MHKVLIFISAGVAIVLSICFASYFVLMKFRPEVEVQRMLVAMSELESFRHQSGMTWTQSEVSDRVNTLLYLSGQVDLSSPTDVQHDTRFRFVRRSHKTDFSELNGQMRLLNAKTYLLYTPPGPDVAGLTFDGKTWIQFGPEELALWGSVIPGLHVPISSALSKRSWTQEEIERLRLLLTVADIFAVKFDGVSELIGGVNTRLIDGQFDPQALRSFLLGLIRSKEGREPTDAERLAVEAQASELDRLTIRLWIGFKDHLLYRFQAVGGLTQEGVNDLVPTDVRVDLFDFNQPFSVTEPTSRLALSQLRQVIVGNLPETATLTKQQREAQVIVSNDVSRLPVRIVPTSDDQDQDGLSRLLETFYGTSVTNADTDQDGMSDGEEVLRARNPNGNGSLFGFGLGN